MRRYTRCSHRARSQSCAFWSATLHDLRLDGDTACRDRTPFGLAILKFVRDDSRSEDQGPDMRQQSSRTQVNFEPRSQKNEVADSVVEFRQVLCLP